MNSQTSRSLSEPADQMVRYCPECGSIGPVPPEYHSCCPDSCGMSVRRWQAEKIDRMLGRLRDQIVASRRSPAVGDSPAPAQALALSDAQIDAALEAGGWLDTPQSRQDFRRAYKAAILSAASPAPTEKPTPTGVPDQVERDPTHRREGHPRASPAPTSALPVSVLQQARDALAGVCAPIGSHEAQRVASAILRLDATLATALPVSGVEGMGSVHPAADGSLRPFGRPLVQKGALSGGSELPARLSMPSVQAMDDFGVKFAERLFAGRKGHGGGPCSYMRLTEQDLARMLSVAYDEGARALILKAKQ